MAGKKNKKSGEVVDDAIDGVTDESKVVSSEQSESIDPIGMRLTRQQTQSI